MLTGMTSDKIFVLVSLKMLTMDKKGKEFTNGVQRNKDFTLRTDDSSENICMTQCIQWVVTSKDHLLYLTCIVLAKAYIDENSQFFNLNK